MVGGKARKAGRAGRADEAGEAGEAINRVDKVVDKVDKVDIQKDQDPNLLPGHPYGPLTQRKGKRKGKEKKLNPHSPSHPHPLLFNLLLKP